MLLFTFMVYLPTLRFSAQAPQIRDESANGIWVCWITLWDFPMGHFLVYFPRMFPEMERSMLPLDFTVPRSTLVRGLNFATHVSSK